MKTAEPPVIRLADYTAPAFQLENVALEFDLEPERTKVTSTLKLRRADGDAEVLDLDGEDQELLSVHLDGRELAAGEYELVEGGMRLKGLPDRCEVTITSLINPAANTKLEGLYKSGVMYCTQCEAEGFRRITYFPDRPDVMTTYRVTIRADKATNPVLLSNGNNVENGDLPDGRHYAVWDDPFPKPAYLFALVAGDLAMVEDRFRTMGGRDVTLRIFVEHGNETRCDYAMDALIRSMKWDEERFNLEYDLDIFNIVAVSDFNMGAMENKSLNIFNAKYILADSDTATDADFANVEGIVAHEYFHNWTGNRVTCRDWFQLSLKEGLTVFRDQEFSADERSRPVKRIEDVRLLRARQFPEDAGPLSHPVRPDSYIEINNFYTATVYEKGAEVIRMMHSLLGEEAFQKGMALYFDRHDGQAVTCDDFAAAMADASGIDLGLFKRWYSQAGTPHVTLEGSYDPAAQSYSLTVRQQTPATPGQPSKQPLLIPLKLALLGPDGAEMAVTLEGVEAQEHLLQVTEAEQRFTFTGVSAEPVLSANRDFSAPVIVKNGQGDQERAFLLAHDGNAFARWEAGQQYASTLLMRMIDTIRAGDNPTQDDAYLTAMGAVLGDETLDPAFKALLMTLPSEEYLAEQMEVVDVEAIHTARETLRGQLARAHAATFRRLYGEMASNAPFLPSAEAAGRRSLRNLSLAYLAKFDEAAAPALLMGHFANADNMTDTVAAFSQLCARDCPERDEAITRFHDRWKDNAQVMDKWLALQAMSPREDTLVRVRELLDHPVFTMRNPNKVRSLIGAFAVGNALRFHAADGSGYDFLADRVIELDAMNPQVAARMLGVLGHWRRFDNARQERMKAALARVLETEGLSRDTFEIASKALGE